MVTKGRKIPYGHHKATYDAVAILWILKSDHECIFR